MARSSNNWISTREIMKMENQHSQRAVVSWAMRGAAYQRGRRVPGDVRLMLSGGGWLWYPEETSLAAAIADARDQGFDVSEVQRSIDEWIRTGTGATFTLGE